MLKSIVLAAIIGVTGATSALAQQCLHGPNETPANRARREKAIDVAHQINALEAMTAVPGIRNPRYKRPIELKLPPMPEGFGLTFHTDGRIYAFSLKDDRDPCFFAVFSDQDGFVYATNPEPHAATVVPLGTT